MTVTTSTTTGVAPVDTVTLTIDGIDIAVPKGTLIIRAAEQLGVAVPRFCDHPLLEPVAACRMCLIEVEGQPKPQPACAVTCSDGMVVRTQLTSAVADEAQRGVMEFLLINHPLDCPVCDKGGECPLQNQAMTEGNGETRFDGAKRLFPKPINVSAQVLLDRERCVSCARCTRFSEQIAGDPFIELLERGADQQVGIAQDVPFNSYYSGNTIQICPVGALTSALYRFRARPFDLVSTQTTCEHCASGCQLRTDVRRGSILRRLAASDPAVNEDWNCDKGRFAFRYVESDERITHPMVRDGDDGALRVASWPEALDAAARGLRAAGRRTGVMTGGRLTVEDAYAYAKFARVVLKTNNVDFRARAASHEEADFLGSSIAGARMTTTYADLEAAPTVLLVAFEPEDESPIVQLRLRKATRRGSLKVFSMGAVATRGLAKLDGELVTTVPGEEPRALDALSDEGSPVGQALREPGAVLVVGERAAGLPGTLSAVLRLAQATGASVAWVPRRAGERGAVESGLLPGLLPGGRPVSDAAARVDAAAVWGVDSVPDEPGLDLPAMLAGCASGELSAVVVAGLDVDDLPDSDAAIAALDTVDFVVALDTHRHDVTERADVVLPVAAAPEKAGSYLDWEGRDRPFGQAVRHAAVLSDARVLSWLATELDVDLGLDTLDRTRAELAQFDAWGGDRVSAPDLAPADPAQPSGRELVLAGWRALIDPSVLQDGEPYLAATARPLVARVAPRTAADLGLADGDDVTVSGPSGAVRRRIEVVPMAAGVVVLTEHVHRELGVAPGSVVTVSSGGLA